MREKYLIMRKSNQFDMQFLWNYYNANGGVKMDHRIFEQGMRFFLQENHKSVMDFLDFEFKVTVTTLPNGKVVHVA